MMAPGNICTMRKESIIHRFPRKSKRLNPYAAGRTTASPHRVVPAETRRELPSHVRKGRSVVTEATAGNPQVGAWPREKYGPMRGRFAAVIALKFENAVPTTIRTGNTEKIAKRIRKTWRRLRSRMDPPRPWGSHCRG